MTSFTPISATAGGLLIGFSALLLILLDGRIAGISGILGDFLAFRHGEILWRLAFIAGLVVAPLVYAAVLGHLPPMDVTHSAALLICAGFLVGFGTRMGSGCTSGHGVCGVARLSPRSIVATLVFIATGAASVFIARHILGA
jgi:uncharacterized membrane protein YedE/YeeE